MRTTFTPSRLQNFVLVWFSTLPQSSIHFCLLKGSGGAPTFCSGLVLHPSPVFHPFSLAQRQWRSTNFLFWIGSPPFPSLPGNFCLLRDNGRAPLFVLYWFSTFLQSSRPCRNNVCGAIWCQKKTTELCIMRPGVQMWEALQETETFKNSGGTVTHYGNHIYCCEPQTME